MVKKLIVILSLSLGLQGQNVYERNCIPCHETLPTSLEQMFMSYLAAYSGEKNLKTVSTDPISSAYRFDERINNSKGETI